MSEIPFWKQLQIILKVARYENINVQPLVLDFGLVHEYKKQFF